MIAKARSVLGCVVLFGAGCVTAVFPPKDAADPVKVYITDYGRHSSLLLRDPDSQLLREFAFADWNWFAINQNSSGDAVNALLFSAGSTLSRRHVDATDDIADVRQKTGACTVQSFPAPRDKVNRLLAHLDGVFNSHLDTITYNPQTHLWYVRTSDRYSAWHNCNHITTRWLHYLGCNTRGLGAFSKFKVLDGAPAPATPRD